MTGGGDNRTAEELIHCEREGVIEAQGDDLPAASRKLVAAKQKSTNCAKTASVDLRSITTANSGKTKAKFRYGNFKEAGKLYRWY